jgi:hypothetical protein
MKGLWYLVFALSEYLPSIGCESVEIRDGDIVVSFLLVLRFLIHATRPSQAVANFECGPRFRGKPGILSHSPLAPKNPCLKQIGFGISVAHQD